MTADESSGEYSRTPVEVEIARVCDILGAIAEGYAPDSAESIALMDAAAAFQAVQLNRRLKEAYEKLRYPLSGELSAEAIDELRVGLKRYGIELDDFEDDEPDDTDSLKAGEGKT